MRLTTPRALLLGLMVAAWAVACAVAPSGSSAALRGDANCSGGIDSIDAALVLQQVAGLASGLPCTANADANGDGSVNSIDAALILQRVAGLIHDFPGTPSAPSPTRTRTRTRTPTRTPTATATAGPAIQCGVERWSVKTLSDPDVGMVNFTPVDSSVAELRALAAPAHLPAASRIAPAELTVFSVIAQLVEYKREDDRDIHLVIASPDNSSETMIVEFPNATLCAGAVDSAYAAEMRTARAQIVAAFGEPPTSSFRALSGTATITGVGFFDFLHGQTGVAPNGIELHPVLSFSLSSGGPTPTLAPPPTPGPASYPCEVNASCNCSDFPTHAEAQRVFLLHGGSPTNNWAGLDGNHNGVACESLP